MEREGNQAKKAEWAKGGWYVRNAAKANTKPPPHTPESNEINAANFSCTKATSDQDARTVYRAHAGGRGFRSISRAELELVNRGLLGCVNRK